LSDLALLETADDLVLLVSATRLAALSGGRSGVRLAVQSDGLTGAQLQLPEGVLDLAPVADALSLRKLRRLRSLPVVVCDEQGRSIRTLDVPILIVPAPAA